MFISRFLCLYILCTAECSLPETSSQSFLLIAFIHVVSFPTEVYV